MKAELNELIQVHNPKLIQTNFLTKSKQLKKGYFQRFVNFVLILLDTSQKRQIIKTYLMKS